MLYLMQVLAAAAAAILLLPLLLEASCWIQRLRRMPRFATSGSGGRDGSGKARLLFLIPAHNEAAFLPECLRSLRRMSGRAAISRLVVAADACSDTTEAIATAHGVDVRSHRGIEPLGKALLLGRVISELPVSDYDAIVIVDADSVVDPSFADEMAAVPDLRRVAAQGRLGVLKPDASWISLLADLLVAVKFDGQLPLKADVGLNSPLVGNGMCIGSELLERLGWKCATIKEDLELYARFTAAGAAIRYVPGARVFAHQPVRLADARTQRIRWQRGRLDIIRMYARTLLTAPRSPLQRFDALNELLAFGPVLHATLALLFASIMALFGRPWSLLGLVALGGTLPMLFWTTRAFARRPDRIRIGMAMLRLPLYALWRLLVAAAIPASLRDGRWERSPRPDPGGVVGSGQPE